MNKITLQAGQLYQVNDGKNWVIAEYVKEIAAHSYRYNNLSLATCTVGPERVRHVPLSHQWRRVIPRTFTFTVADRGMDIRPVTQEALDTITQLKAEIAHLDQLVDQKRKELRAFCS
jgi:hypothetical protein